MLYTIEDKTLTALGDAVRSYTGKYSYLDTPTSQPYEISLDTREIEPFNQSGNRRYYLPSIDIREIFKDRYTEIKQLYYEVSYTASVGDYTEAKFTILFDECKEPDNSYNSIGLGVRETSPIENTVTGLLRVDVATTPYPYRRFGAFIKTTYNNSYYLVAHLKLWACDAQGRFIDLNTMTPLEMVDEVYGIIDDFANAPTIPEEALTITGDCSHRFYNGGWDWFLKKYGDKITTKDITNADYMFAYSTLQSIPFEINFKEGGGKITQMFQSSAFEVIPSIDFKQSNTGSYTYKNWDSIFAYSKIKEIGTMKNLYPDQFGGLFENAYYLRYLPKIENLDGSYATTYSYASNDSVFSNCKSLRSIPEDFLKQIYGCQNSYFYCHLSSMFSTCSVLDEVRGVMPVSGAITSNMLNNTAYNCYRLKDFIFAFQEDGTPYTAQWKNQTFDLTTVGWAAYAQLGAITNAYNSGITADKQVRTDAEYQALKDDPDWFALDVNYSRYNHDSAVNTINSLPDCSAYGTNTIKFNGKAGALTDGGAINTLTEEEIAVAAAKGWTVSLS